MLQRAVAMLARRERSRAELAQALRRQVRDESELAEVDAVLDRADELEWHCKGRFVASYGHPFMFFKLKAT